MQLTKIQKNLQRLEDESLKLPQINIETNHYTADNVYVRSIIIPKGSTVTGAVHLTDTIDIMVYGNLIVVTEEGKRHITEPGSIFYSKKGLKKVAYAIEDTMWITAHGLEKTNHDIKEIEKLIAVPSYNDYYKLLEDK